jgi:hypothetical protein
VFDVKRDENSLLRVFERDGRDGRSNLAVFATGHARG